MAARRTTSFSPRRTSPNRAWSGINANGNISAASTKILLGSLVLTNPGIDETVLRMAGIMSIQSDQVVASEDQIGAFGMIIVSTDAASAGVASIPGPITDPNASWFVYVPFVERFEFDTGSGFVADFSRNYMVASKARRVLQDNQSIALVAESTSLSEGVNIKVVGRLLGQVRGT